MSWYALSCKCMQRRVVGNRAREGGGVSFHNQKGSNTSRQRGVDEAWERTTSIQDGR